jgi:hypothetical protein
MKMQRLRNYCVCFSMFYYLLIINDLGYNLTQDNYIHYITIKFWIFSMKFRYLLKKKIVLNFVSHSRNRPLNNHILRV